MSSVQGLAAVPSITSVRPPVGVAKAEAFLTQAAMARPQDLVHPGRGYSLVVLDEVEVGVGRPDIIIATVSLNGLDAWIRAGRLIENLTEARVLGALYEPREAQTLAITADHVRAVRSRLANRGWTRRGVPVGTPMPIQHALVLEAKVSDWRSGIVQLNGRRHLFPQAALLLPDAVARRVPRVLIDWSGVGIAAAADSGELRWIRKPRSRSASIGARLWLSHLVASHVAAGFVYGPRCSLVRTRSNAALNGASSPS